MHARPAVQPYLFQQQARILVPVALPSEVAGLQDNRKHNMSQVYVPS
jgi:hypothetical protein